MYIKRNRGFTLIELLVVIAIIGILSSVVLASLNSARLKSRDARRISDMAQLQIAMELFFDSCRTYPSSSEALPTIALTNSSCPGSETLGDYIAAIPSEPVASRQSYLYLSNGTTYCVGADMEGTPPIPDDTCGTDLADGDIDYMRGP